MASSLGDSTPAEHLEKMEEDQHREDDLSDTLAEKFSGSCVVQRLPTPPLFPYATIAIAIDPIYHLFVLLYPVATLHDMHLETSTASPEVFRVLLHCALIEGQPLSSWMTYMPDPPTKQPDDGDYFGLERHNFFVTNLTSLAAVFGKDTKFEFSLCHPTVQSNGYVHIGNIKRRGVPPIPIAGHGSSGDSKAEKMEVDPEYNVLTPEQHELWKRHASHEGYQNLRFVDYPLPGEKYLVRRAQRNMIADIVRTDDLIRFALYGDTVACTHIVHADAYCNGMAAVLDLCNATNFLYPQDWDCQEVYGNDPNPMLRELFMSIFGIIPVHADYAPCRQRLILDTWLRSVHKWRRKIVVLEQEVTDYEGAWQYFLGEDVDSSMYDYLI